MTTDELKLHYTNQLPDLKRIAQYYFRHVDAERRDENTQNVLCLTWKYARSLVLQDRFDDPGLLRSVLFYAIRQTKSGRRIQGKARSKCVYDHARKGRINLAFADLDELAGKKTSVFDRVVFRIDIPALLATLNPQQRLLAFDLAGSMTTKEAAARHGVTPGAISQFRRRFKQLHDAFFSG
jgi:hypothetical protein